MMKRHHYQPRGPCICYIDCRCSNRILVINITNEYVCIIKLQYTKHKVHILINIISVRQTTTFFKNEAYLHNDHSERKRHSDRLYMNLVD